MLQEEILMIIYSNWSKENKLKITYDALTFKFLRMNTVTAHIK